MKNTYFIVFLSLIAHVTFAQSSERIEKILESKRQSVERLKVENSSTITLLPTRFSADNFVSTEIEQRLEELTTVKVYYVYTRYRQNAEFNQRELDRRRLIQLQKMAPTLISDPFVEWEIIEQTGCKSPESGNDFFHGFVLVHRPAPSSNEYLLEMERLKAYFRNPTNEFVEPEMDLVKKQLSSEPSKTASNEVKQSESLSRNAEYKNGNKALLNDLKISFAGNEEVVTKRIDKWVNVNVTVSKDSTITDVKVDSGTPENLQSIVEQGLFDLKKWIPAKENGKDKDTVLKMEVRVSYSREVSGMYTINGNRPVFEPEPTVVLEKPKPDNSYAELQKTLLNASTVYKGMERLSKEEKFALVMDVTGSMAGNIAAMKRWIELRNDSIRFTSFSFFNDGDGRATRFKKIGKTGGIYTTYSEKEIANTIEFAMDKGSGGERSESDFEAVLHAQNADSLCSAVLLIADNYSEVRDAELLSEIRVPVHVLICAAPNGVREEYVNLAWKTKGVLIYYGEVIDVCATTPGQTLFIGPASYSFNGKQFKRKEE